MLDRKPSNFLFLNNMAWTLSEDLNQPEEGLKRVDEALERVGRQPHLLDTRGVILTRLGQLDEAVKDLEAAAAALPAGPVDFHLARAYQKKGQARRRPRPATAPARPASAPSSSRTRSGPTGTRS